MKKKQLEILLERMEGFHNPIPELEQYATPACVAAEMLYLAYMHGDLGVVCDLGCGTGMLAVGAALLGAKAIGVEVDTQALSVARRNADKMGVEVDFIQGDIKLIDIEGNRDCDHESSLWCPEGKPWRSRLSQKGRQNRKSGLFSAQPGKRRFH